MEVRWRTADLRSHTADLRLPELAELRDMVHAEVAKAVVGHERAVDLMLVSALAGGHVLIEGPPGTAKTLLAWSMARVLGVPFKRVQFTPDTTPSELIGRVVVRGSQTAFEPGVLFTNVLLADEVNRTPPRTQAALLEAMQEGRVTLAGESHALSRPFIVIATENPFEFEGVFPLPESQLDRFLFKVSLKYGSPDEELRVLGLPHRGVVPDVIGDVSPLLGDKRFLFVQEVVDATHVPEKVGRYVVSIVRKTRELKGVVLGASPRAAIHLLSAAKANARLSGRDTVAQEDVDEMAPFVLRHRLVLDGTSADEVIATALESAATLLSAG
jgi:MoxR-like ATPase